MRQPKKGYWTGDEVTGYERKQRLVVARNYKVLGTIIDLVPYGGSKHE